jgi:Rieske Fe-S protein
MPIDEDKYPAESGRRRFVKGVVGSATLSSVGAGGAAALDSVTSSSGVGGGASTYVAIENTAGPAPRGMPLVPLTIEGGELQGIWPEYDPERGIAINDDFGGSGIPYSSQMLQYCGLQTAEGVQPDAEQNNTFVMTTGDYAWQSDYSDGDPLTVDMFSDYQEWGNSIGSAGLGKPATANWRSEGDVKSLPVQVLRSPEVPKIANGEGKYSEIPGPVRQYFAEATEESFMAWINKCTHFCCVPGYKTLSGSAAYNAEDKVYCQCHQSVYDPFSPTQVTFTALPRPPQ